MHLKGNFKGLFISGLLLLFLRLRLIIQVGIWGYHGGVKIDMIKFKADQLAGIVIRELR